MEINEIIKYLGKRVRECVKVFGFLGEFRLRQIQPCASVAPANKATGTRLELVA
jgi:hypothetical protein